MAALADADANQGFNPIVPKIRNYNWKNSVRLMPRCRRFYDVTCDDGMICVVSVGEPFECVLPSFDVLTVELRQIKCFGLMMMMNRSSMIFLFLMTRPHFSIPILLGCLYKT